MCLVDENESSIFVMKLRPVRKDSTIFNDYSRDFELRCVEFELSLEEAHVPVSVEGFLHVKKDGSGVYVVVKVLAKLVNKFGQF